MPTQVRQIPRADTRQTKFSHFEGIFRNDNEASSNLLNVSPCHFVAYWTGRKEMCEIRQNLRVCQANAALKCLDAERQYVCVTQLKVDGAQ
jgi:hypothetical protein